MLHVKFDIEPTEYQQFESNNAGKRGLNAESYGFRQWQFRKSISWPIAILQSSQTDPEDGRWVKRVENGGASEGRGDAPYKRQTTRSTGRRLEAPAGTKGRNDRPLFGAPSLSVNSGMMTLPA